MNRIALIACTWLLAICAHAQERPLPAVNPATPAPRETPIMAPRMQATDVDEHALNQRLAAKNVALHRENEALKTQVATLAAGIDSFTSKGGSQVHAYCENPSLSRNTAGAQADCNAAGYMCEPVSGLCRTTCQTSLMCAVGWSCNTESQHCEPPGS